jgi:hypothetical protein
VKQHDQDLVRKQTERVDVSQQEAQKYADENFQIDALCQTREGMLMESAKASRCDRKGDSLLYRTDREAGGGSNSPEISASF